MKYLKNGLPILALVLAVAASAFTTVERLDSDLVWFKVNPSTGQALDPSDGHQGDEPPAFMDCQGEVELCSRALSISQNEVEANSTPGSYSIADNVDITSSYNDQRLEE